MKKLFLLSMFAFGCSQGESCPATTKPLLPYKGACGFELRCPDGGNCRITVYMPIDRK